MRMLDTRDLSTANHLVYVILLLNGSTQRNASVIIVVTLAGYVFDLYRQYYLEVKDS